MRVFASIFLVIAALAVFSGCSEKQFNDTTDDLVNQVSDIGENATEQRE